MQMPTHVILMVTRNRHADLEATLGEIEAQKTEADLHLVLVDASDPDLIEKTRKILNDVWSGQVDHYVYTEKPSAARQRNYGMDRLPSEAEIVYFLDDDIKLYPGFLQELADALKGDPQLGAVGGNKMTLEGRYELRPSSLFWLRNLFLLDSREPCRLLLSGCTSVASTPITRRTEVDWLTSCGMAVRREVADKYRWDQQLLGHSLHDDIDFTYRISLQWKVAIEPDAKFVHYKSSVNRTEKERYATLRLLHRYWIVEKNLRHTLSKPAFWWSTFGRVLLLLISRNPDAKTVLRGTIKGIPKVIKRDYHMLRPINDPEQPAV